MSVEDLSLLRKTIEKTFGRSVSAYKECVALHEDIFKKTGLHLSVHTLRRFFGHVKSRHSLTSTTLHVLATYCGYNSVEQLLGQAGRTAAVNESLLAYLVTLFGDATVPNPDDPVYTGLVRQTILFLKKEPGLVEPLQEAIAKTENGRRFYFERFINLDQLNGAYGAGLRHYLRHAQTPCAAVFAHSLLAFRGWLTGEDPLFWEHRKGLKARLRKDMPTAAQAYCFAVELLGTQLTKKGGAAVLKGARKFYGSLGPAGRKEGAVPTFPLVLAAASALTGEWGEALFYATEGLAGLEGEGSPALNQTVKQTFRLCKALALAHLGEREKALGCYQRIEPNEFYFLAKKLHLFFYTHLGLRLNKIRKGGAQLGLLTEQTGFLRLGDLFTGEGLNKNKQ